VLGVLATTNSAERGKGVRPLRDLHRCLGWLIVLSTISGGCEDPPLLAPSPPACHIVEHPATVVPTLTTGGVVLVVVPAWTETVCRGQ